MTQMKLTFCKGKLLFKEGKEYPPHPPGNVTIEMGLLKKNGGYKFQQIRSAYIQKASDVAVMAFLAKKMEVLVCT